MNAAIYWKGMRTTVRSVIKSCKSCQVNKRRKLKNGHLPSKISNKHSMGGFMCRPSWPVHTKRLRWICNRFHGTHHDQPRLKLVQNSGICASQLTNVRGPAQYFCQIQQFLAGVLALKGKKRHTISVSKTDQNQKARIPNAPPLAEIGD